MQLYHTQAELQELGLDHHQLLKMLKERGEEFVYDEANDDDDEVEDEFLSVYDHLDPVRDDSDSDEEDGANLGE